jgi:hypothetical protein
MKTKAIGMLLLVLVGEIAPLQGAEIVRGRWEKVEALKPGTAIVVKLNSGDRIDGAYQGAEPELLRINDAAGVEFRLPKFSVLSVESAEKVRDPLANGALIGAGAGAAAGFFSMLGFAKAVTASGPIFDGEGAGFFIAAALVGAGVGAVTGTLIDAKIKGRQVFYLSR